MFNILKGGSKCFIIRYATIFAFSCCMVAVGLGGSGRDFHGKIDSPNPVFDYGVLTNYPGLTVTNRYVLQNTGTKPLRIDRIRGCCGASLDLDDDVIKPQTNTILTVELRLAGRSGAQRKAFYVHSSDALRPVLQLLAIGKLIPPVD